MTQNKRNDLSGNFYLFILSPTPQSVIYRESAETFQTQMDQAAAGSLIQTAVRDLL